MKKILLVLIMSICFVGLKLNAEACVYPYKSFIIKPMAWISVADSLPPLNTLVRTHVEVDGLITNEQKAIRKEDGWYYPSGLTLLSWVPTHWESM